MKQSIVSWAIFIAWEVSRCEAFQFVAPSPRGNFALQSAAGDSVKPIAADEATQQRLDQIRSNLAASRSNGQFVDKREHDSVSVELETDPQSEPVADGGAQARLDQIRAARSANSVQATGEAGPLSVVSMADAGSQIGQEQIKKSSGVHQVGGFSSSEWEDDPTPLSEACGYSVLP